MARKKRVAPKAYGKSKGIPTPVLVVGGFAAVGTVLYVLARSAMAAQPGVEVTIGPAEVEQAPGGTAPRRLTAPYSLRQGKVYRVRLELDPAAASATTPAQLRSALESQGFSRLTTWASEGLLEPTWPDEARAGATPNTRWAAGYWSRPDAVVRVLPGIDLVWEG